MKEILMKFLGTEDKKPWNSKTALASTLMILIGIVANMKPDWNFLKDLGPEDALTIAGIIGLLLRMVTGGKIKLKV